MLFERRRRGIVGKRFGAWHARLPRAAGVAQGIDRLAVCLVKPPDLRARRLVALSLGALVGCATAAVPTASSGEPRPAEAERIPEALVDDAALLPHPTLRWPAAGPDATDEMIRIPVAFVPSRQVVIVRNDRGELQARMVETGRTLWALAPPPPVTGALETLQAFDADGVLLVSRGDGLAALNVATGAALWNAPLGGTPEGRAFVAAGRVVFWCRGCALNSPASGALVALDLADGREVWRSASESPGIDAVGAGTYVVAAGPAEATSASEPRATDVTVRRAADGVVKQSVRVAGRVVALSASETGDILVLAGEDGRRAVLAGRRLPTLEPAWEVELPATPLLGPQAGDELLVAAAGTMRWVDRATGATRVASELGELLPEDRDCVAGPVLAGDAVLFATSPACGAARLVLLDAATLRPRRLLAGPAEPVRSMWADARTAVLGLANDVLIVDLLDFSVVPAGPGADEFRELARGIDELRARGRPEDLAAFEPRAEALVRKDGIVAAVRDALSYGSSGARTAAALVLRYRWMKETAPLVLSLLVELAERQALLASVLFRAIEQSGDPQVVPVLTALLETGRFSYRAVLLALARIGSPEALAAIDAFRQSCAARREPWLPDFTGEDVRRLVSTEDGVTFAERDSELWVITGAPGGTTPLFTGVTLDEGQHVKRGSARSADDGIAVVLAERVRGSATTVDEDVALKWEDLLRDADGDGWTDVLERRMGTDPSLADTDGDGVGDALDVAPLGKVSRPTDCSRDDLLRAAFFVTWVGISAPTMDPEREGRIMRVRERPTIVAGPDGANLSYERCGAPVLFIPEEESEGDSEDPSRRGRSRMAFHIFDPEIWQEEEAEGGVGSQISSASRGPGSGEAHVALIAAPEGWEPELRDSCVILRCVAGRWYATSVQHAGYLGEHWCP